MRRSIPLLVLVVLLASVTPVAAQSELDQARARAEAAGAAADDARDAALAAQARADALAERVENAVAEAEAVDGEIAVVQVRADDAAAEATALRTTVEDLLVQRYVLGQFDDSDIATSAAPTEAATAGALARFAALGVGDEVDRYRVVTDDLDAANRELVSLRADLETALIDLRANEAQMIDELAEVQRQLELAEEAEAEFVREVERLEEEERRRLEEERRRREAERRRQEEERRRQAAEEAARLAEERRRAEEAAAATSTTTTTTIAPTTTQAPTTTDGTTPEGADGESPDTTESTDATPETTEAPAPTTTTTIAEPELRGGDFLCPVGGPTSFFDTFGAARSGGRRHKGVDMFATRGTPVVAPVSGVVRHRTNRLGGLAFYLDGDDGNRYYGAHLDSFGVEGRVEAGAVVGTVGNTGNARYTSPHLHFEIMPGGGASVNPTPTVRAACG